MGEIEQTELVPVSFKQMLMVTIHIKGFKEVLRIFVIILSCAF